MGDVANTSSHCIIKQMVKNMKSVLFQRMTNMLLGRWMRFAAVRQVVIIRLMLKGVKLT